MQDKLKAIRAIADQGGRRIETAMDACDRIIAICDEAQRDGGRMLMPSERGAPGQTLPRPPLVARLNAASRNRLEEMYEAMDALGEDAEDAAAFRTLLDWYDNRAEVIANGTLKFEVKYLNMQNRWMSFHLPDCPEHFETAALANAAIKHYRKTRKPQPATDDTDYWKVDVTMVK